MKCLPFVWLMRSLQAVVRKHHSMTASGICVFVILHLIIEVVQFNSLIVQIENLQYMDQMTHEK